MLPGGRNWEADLLLLPGGRNWKLICCCCLVVETGSLTWCWFYPKMFTVQISNVFLCKLSVLHWLTQHWSWWWCLAYIYAKYVENRFCTFWHCLLWHWVQHCISHYLTPNKEPIWLIQFKMCGFAFRFLEYMLLNGNLSKFRGMYQLFGHMWWMLLGATRCQPGSSTLLMM